MAKDMTHESQQSAVLDRIRHIATTTAMNLDEEIEELKCGWRVASYSEGTTT